MPLFKSLHLRSVAPGQAASLSQRNLLGMKIHRPYSRTTELGNLGVVTGVLL